MPLDEQQLEIVNSTEDNIIVVAGAGSGKTTVLTERIRYLINNLHVRPCDIVAITFTNMAADEMKSRLTDIPDINDAFIGTIHSFANKILWASGMSYSLLTDEMHVRLCTELITKYAEHLTLDRYNEFHDMASKVKYGLYTKRDLEDFFDIDEKEEYNELYAIKPDKFPESIPTICMERNIITFDQLLQYAKNYLQKTGRSIEYCLVDEFQDVGNLENRFVESLDAKHYFVVGDDWQSIYKFKGANVEIFKNRIKNNDWHVYYMTNNYRNATAILDCANSVISDVSDRIDKTINPMRTKKGTVLIKPKSSLNEWLETIKKIGEFKTWFFLARTNADCNKLLKKCQDIGIPAFMIKQSAMSSLEERNAMLALDGVKILTVHSAKGLETDRVLLYGDFPVNLKSKIKKDYYYKRRNQRKAADPEERRIMYVGVTRARDHLLILN